MNTILALFALVGIANAGYLAQPQLAYQTAAVAVPAAQSHQFNNRAPAARIAVAAPVYTQQVAYQPQVAVAHAIPAAQSHQFNNRAPAARIAVAAPVYAQPQLAYAPQVAVAHHAVAAPVAYAAPAVAHHAVVHQTFSTPFASYAW